MKCLVIGLGSMGKRRIRCLKALGFNDITGYDPREDRRNEASAKYKIDVISNYNEFDLSGAGMIIISTPPDKHLQYASDAIRKKIPCFIEASVLVKDVEEMIEQNKMYNSYVAPSCTLKFHPLIARIKTLVDSGEMGSVTNFTYHCGQYLPDWHPWEQISDYYVSVKETGGAREIVPFELTWLTWIFGIPGSVKGYFARTSDLKADIDDTYAFSMKFPGFIGNVVVDVVSRFATRSLILNFEKAQVRWNWEENEIRVFSIPGEEWTILKGIHGKAEEGYNKNIIEDMYIEEIRHFVKGIDNPELFPNNPGNDYMILKLLEQIEKSDGGFKRKLQ